MSSHICALLSYVTSLVLIAQTAIADERDDRIRALEKRVEQLEKLLQAGITNAATANVAVPTEPTDKPKPLPTVSIGPSGFSARSADSNFAIRVRGLLQVDSRWDIDGDDLTDSFLIRRARPILEGTVFRDFNFLFTPEFAGSSPTIRDAWINYRYNDPLQLRVGKMKPPGNLERWQSAANIPFIERSYPSLLWPVRELGVMLHGELWPGTQDISETLAADGLVNYSLGAFNGTGDGSAAGNSDFDDSKSFAGRLFFHPLLIAGRPALRRFGLGVSGTYGRMEGDGGLPDDIEYADNVTADGTNWRLGPQAYWYWKRFGLLGEYSISSQQLRLDDPPFSSIRAENHAWSITASWMLTGEESTFRAVKPDRDFDPRDGGWGAWQFVARYTVLDLDDELTQGFADPGDLPTKASTWGVGVNWYLNRNLRLELNYDHTDFKGGQGSSIGQGEHLLATRVQLSF